MSNTNSATAAGLSFLGLVSALFSNVAPFNNPENALYQSTLTTIFDLINSAASPLIQEYLGILVPLADVMRNNEIQVINVPYLNQILTAINSRSNAVCAPQLLKNPAREDLQGTALRCIDGKEEIVNLNTSNLSDFNDVQISADSSVMVAAGSGTRKRFFPNQNNMDPFRKCSENPANLTSLKQETYGGIEIYKRALCSTQGTCTTAANSGLPDWRLTQSALQDATITSVHVSDDGSSIVAYDLYSNTLYILRNNSCGSNFGRWETVQTLRLEPTLTTTQNYAICGKMHACANQSIIVINTKNITTNTRKLYIVTNSFACEQVNGLLNTSVSKSVYSVAQVISDASLLYNSVTISRDGQTLLVEYGTASPAANFTATSPEAAGTVVENGTQGVQVFHWQPVSAEDCTCQFVSRQTIVYETVPTNYDNVQAKYLSQTVGRTIQIFFSGANDNRIMRLVDRCFLINQNVSAPRNTRIVVPSDGGIGWRQNVAESPVLQVFDRSDLSVSICGKPVANCTEGIVNREGTDIKRGTFEAFVAKPSVYLKGCDFRNEPYDMLYTHRTNKHIFVTWCSFFKAIHTYVESDQDGVWVQVPSSKYPFDFLATTAADQAVGFRGYLAFTENANCGQRRNVCFPLVQSFAGQFIFRTISTNPGTAGYYNGSNNPVVDLGNNNYYTPSDSFIVSQIDQPDNPFLGGFPVTKTTLPNPGLQFTRSGNIVELPGSPAIPATIPFPLQFNVWQRWPKDDPRFPQCRVGYFKITAQNPFLRIGCNTTAEFVLTPKYYLFDPNSTEPEPDPNVDPLWIFSRSIAPAYITLSTICVNFECAEQSCRAPLLSYPYYYRSGFTANEPV